MALYWNPLQPAMEICKNLRFLFASQCSCKWWWTDHCWKTEATKGKSAIAFILGKYSHLGRQTRMFPSKNVPSSLGNIQEYFFLAGLLDGTFVTSSSFYFRAIFVGVFSCCCQTKIYYCMKVLNVIWMLSGQWIPLKFPSLLVNFAFCMPFFGKLMTLAMVSD